MSDLVSMQVSPEIIKPIVETKIKEAIAAALGGPEAIVSTVVERVLSSKVSANGHVSSYSNENKYTWIDAVVTEQIKASVKDAVQEHIQKANGQIQKEVEKFLMTKKGASDIAALLCASMAKSVGRNYSTQVVVKFNENSED